MQTLQQRMADTEAKLNMQHEQQMADMHLVQQQDRATIKALKDEMKTRQQRMAEEKATIKRQYDQPMADMLALQTSGRTLKIHRLPRDAECPEDGDVDDRLMADTLAWQASGREAWSARKGGQCGGDRASPPSPAASAPARVAP